MDFQGAPLADRWAAVSTAAGALRGVRDVLFQCASSDLGELAADLAELRAWCAAGLAAVVAEAETRGVVAESQSASTRAWVADHAWHARRQASTIAKSGRLLRRDDLAPVADAVAATEVDLPTAVAIGSAYDGLSPDLKPAARRPVLEQLVSVGAAHGPRAVRELTEHLLARYGAEGEFEDRTERCRRQIRLSVGRKTEAGLWDYELTVDNEGHAVLEAAIGPLSAPRPDADTGERDPRPAGRRRGEALITALRRSAAATGVGPGSKSTLMVTMDHADLASRVRTAQPGRAVGGLADGTLLTASIVRRLACDATVIPAVLGGDDEVLNQGRAQRLFTPGQVRALWRRDRHCTFDGCDIPGTWCDAHHLVHWIDGGLTDLDNAALLCPRHHTIVHRDELAGSVTADGIVWDRRPGSYACAAGGVTEGDTACATGGVRRQDGPAPPARAGPPGRHTVAGNGPRGPTRASVT